LRRRFLDHRSYEVEVVNAPTPTLGEDEREESESEMESSSERRGSGSGAKRIFRSPPAVVELDVDGPGTVAACGLPWEWGWVCDLGMA
jgi:hypothetical protein